MAKHMSRDEAAFHIWPELIKLAKKHRKIYYSDLADAIGSADRRLGWPLGLIQDYCLTANLPPITILVISKAEGLPGHGFTAWDLGEREAGYSAVWNHNWSTRNPFEYAEDGMRIGDLAKKLCWEPDSAEEIYALVPMRGAAQIVFRKAILKAYGERCAMCGLTFNACLQAAHIIPWVNATRAQKVSPTNGLCLCANHHQLFDSGRITIDKSGHIVCSIEGDAHTAGDCAALVDLDGKPANMPESRNLWPSAEALGANYERYGWSESPWNLKI